MTYLEKIKAMDIDDMARFIIDLDSHGGFRGKVCNSCPLNSGAYECRSADLDSDCRIAVKALLRTEAPVI